MPFLCSFPDALRDGLHHIPIPNVSTWFFFTFSSPRKENTVKEEQKKTATLANGALKYSSMDQLKGRSAGAGTLKHNRKTTTMVLIIGEGKSKAKSTAL